MSELAPFDPEWLAFEAQTGGRVTVGAGPVNEVRAQFGAIIAGLFPFLPPPTDAVKTEDVHRQDGQRVRIYIPTGVGGSVPVGLYLHSGGWYSGNIEGEDHLCRNIAEHSKIILFSPEYRLAPEHPYPAGMEDCFAAYEYMYANASKYGGDPTKKSLMGGSAGGSLAVSVALKYATDPKLKPSGLVIACLATCDPQALPEEYRKRRTPEKYSDAPMIGNEALAQAREWYNPPKPDEPLYSVLLHPDLKSLPPTYITAATKDPTHQETIFLYEEMKKQGVKVDLVEWTGWPHFFWIIPPFKKSAEFLDVWNEKLRGLIQMAE